MGYSKENKPILKIQSTVVFEEVERINLWEMSEVGQRLAWMRPRIWRVG